MANEGASSSRPGRRLKIFTGMELGQLQTRIQEAIARRAYDLFQRRGSMHGGDLVDWFGAEEEIQRPADVTVREDGSHVAVRVEAPGFSADEIEIGAGPHHVVIWGLKPDLRDSAKNVKPEPSAFGAFLADVSLPSPVNPAKSDASFENGWIEIRLSKNA